MKIKVFEQFNSETPCPICGTTDVRACILVPIAGTQKGLNCEAIQVHEDCLAEGLIYDREYNVIYAT